MENAIAGTIRLGYLRALLDYLDNHYGDSCESLNSELLHHLQDHSLNERVPITIWSDLMSKAINDTGDQALPLKLANELNPKHWGVFSYAAMTCKNLAEVAAILVRYETLIDEANDTLLVLLEDRAGLQWIPRMQNLHPSLMQLSMASWVAFARRHTDREDLVADADFTFPAPADTTEFDATFRGTVRFGQPTTQLLFAKHYLQIPIAFHDPESHRILISQVIQQTENLKQPGELQNNIKKTIMEQLSSGRCTLENVADTLMISPRTLQYQLEQCGTSFRGLLDSTRAELARHYLMDPDMSLVDVAFLLGFSEQSPFTKAFKRWTGETPGEFRKRHSL